MFIIFVPDMSLAKTKHTPERGAIRGFPDVFSEVHIPPGTSFLFVYLFSNAIRPVQSAGYKIA